MHKQLGRIYLEKSILEPTISQFQATFEVQPDTNTGLIIASVFSSAGLFEEALATLEALRRNPQIYSTKRPKQIENIDKLAAEITRVSKENSATKRVFN